MLNFVVDPKIVESLVPSGTEIDFENGETYLSMVGFLFLDTRLLGLPVPLHRDFEEVNLRFYVRRKSADTWRRGVVFVRELVPKRAIATIARVFYGEPYLAVPMSHEIEHTDGKLKVKYSWRRGTKGESINMNASGEAQAIPAGSHAEFITEHYWGYAVQRDGGTVEYQVEHPRWLVWEAVDSRLDCDVRAVYGAAFVEALSAAPGSAFVALGSAVTVRRGVRIA